MEIVLSKQAQKFIKSCYGQPSHKKITKAIAALNPQQDTRLKGIGRSFGNKKNFDVDNTYYHKIEHYRIVYTQQKGLINIKTIDTKTNMKFNKYGTFQLK